MGEKRYLIDVVPVEEDASGRVLYESIDEFWAEESAGRDLCIDCYRKEG